MIESINSFFNAYWVTLVVGLVACVCVSCLVELFKQSVFTKIEEKYEGNNEKLAKVKTIKASSAFAVAGLLTAFFLACIWKSSLPNIGDWAVLPVWFTAMYLLQMVFDIKGIKFILARILGNIVKATEPPKRKNEPPKYTKKKVTSYVYYDRDGNVVDNPEKE